jgi:hypothetical protein
MIILLISDANGIKNYINSLRLTNYQVEAHRQKQTQSTLLLTFNLKYYMSKAPKKKTPLFLDIHMRSQGIRDLYPYLKPPERRCDNTGRHHVGLYGTCDVCDKEFFISTCSHR